LAAHPLTFLLIFHREDHHSAQSVRPFGPSQPTAPSRPKSLAPTRVASQSRGSQRPPGHPLPPPDDCATAACLAITAVQRALRSPPPWEPSVAKPLHSQNRHRPFNSYSSPSHNRRLQFTHRWPPFPFASRPPPRPYKRHPRVLSSPRIHPQLGFHLSISRSLRHRVRTAATIVHCCQLNFASSPVAEALGENRIAPLSLCPSSQRAPIDRSGRTAQVR
jgi:hypothetical protein